MKNSVHIRFLVCFLYFTASCKPERLNGDAPEFEPAVLTRVALPVTENVGGYYMGLPGRYYTNSINNKYPLILCFPGAGCYGNDSASLDNVLVYGVPRYLKTKLVPPFFTVNKTNYSFIILAPQFIERPTNQQITDFLNYAKDNFRIDLSRIYLLGSSVGGRMATDYASEHAAEIAAVVAMSGVSDNDVENKCKAFVDSNLPLWIFHNIEDPAWPISAPKYFIEILNSLNPNIPPKFTIINEIGHSSWVNACYPLYKENGINIYEWMLKFKR